MSKKRYTQFRSYMVTRYDDAIVQDVCLKLCEIMKFDPNFVNSSEEKVAQVKAWRRKKAIELGISISKVAKGLKNIKLPQTSA